MIPKCVLAQREVSFDVAIEDVEATLEKDFIEQGSADKAVSRLRKILDELKEE
ncbi:MAG: hypothetical protein J1F36_01760 [Clostridiales bacterium]|nr:hypothetical protein [Clostridiales bacterium]